MTFTIEISPELAGRIQTEATQLGQESSELAIRVLEERFGSTAIHDSSQSAWETLLDTFAEGDREEQRTDLAQLMQDLDEDRPSQRRIFGSGYNPPIQAPE